MQLNVIVNGKCITVSSVEEASKIAEEEGLDLVRLNENTFKVMDFGKHKYQMRKKEKRTKQATPEVKECQIGYNIAEADLMRKMRDAEEWLLQKHPVRIRIRVKGRERQKSDQIFYLLTTVIDYLDEQGVIAFRPDLHATGDEEKDYCYLIRPRVGGKN